MVEYIVPECGDCLHASLCEMLPLRGFNRQNPAYCKAFKSAANMVEVVRCKDCRHFCPYEGEEHKGDCNELVGLESCVYEDDFCSYGEAKMDGKGE